MKRQIEALTGEYETLLACSTPEGKRLIGLLVVEDGNAWSYRFTVYIKGADTVTHTSLAAAVRHYNNGASDENRS